MGDILTSSTDYASVRRLVGMQLTPEELPDSVISDPVYLGIVEAEVIGLIPGWETSPDLPMIKIATAYLTASLLVPAVPIITSETWNGEHTYVRQPPKHDEISMRYRTIGLGLLGDIVGEAFYDLPTMFSTAGPSRRPFFIYNPQSYDPR